MASEPQPDLFNAIRNRISIIQIKLQRYNRECSDCDKPGHITFWSGIEKDFDTLSALVKEKRVGKRHKGPSHVQKLFFWLFGAVIVLLLGIVGEIYASHHLTNQWPWNKTQINLQNH